ncbi:MAG: TVP38/TMEM64 family protein, partial [Planctomycetota bacterium]
FKVVLLLRLSPVFPFTVLNYALSVTKVSFRQFLLATWLGTLPGTVMYVYLGTALRSLAESVSGDRTTTPAERVFFVAGLIATVVATVVITRIARRALGDGAPEKQRERRKELSVR